MLGALGAVTATAPSEWLLAWIGWRGLFEWLAMATTVAAGIVYLLVPEARLRSTFYKAVGEVISGFANTENALSLRRKS